MECLGLAKLVGTKVIAKYLKIEVHNGIGDFITPFFVLCILGCFGIPEKIISTYGLNLSLYSNRLPYIAPILCLLLFIGIVRFKTKEKLDPWKWGVVIITLATWVATDFLGGRLISFNYVLPQLWFFIFYTTFVVFIRYAGCSNIFFKTIVLTTVFICAIQFLRYFHVVPGADLPLIDIFRGVRPDGLDLNLSSYVAAFGVWVVLFTPMSTEEEWINKHFKSKLYLILIFSMMIVVNRTVGAITLEAITLGLWICKKNGINYKYPLLVFVGVAIAAILYLVWCFWLIESDINKIVSDSIRQRLGSAYVTLQNWLISPFYGVGSGTSLNVRYENMLAHTYYLRVLLAYGIVGTLLFFANIIILFFNAARNDPWALFSGLICLFVILSFESKLPLWCSMIPVLCVRKIKA